MTWHALTGWCLYRDCSSLIFYTKSSHLSEVEFPNSSFNNTISQAGHLGYMDPLNSIQSTQHLFWYNCLLSPRSVVARGMQLNASSALHRKRNQRIYEVLSSINCSGEQKSANESQTKIFWFNAHISYLHSIYLSQKISNKYIRQVWSFSKKSTFYFTFIIWYIFHCVT